VLKGAPHRTDRPRMRRWGILSVIGLSVAVASIVTAVPAHAAGIDTGAAARQFFDLVNGERAAVGTPGLQWRDDVAGMAVAHSAEMANAGTIWHGSFVSEANLKALNASLLAENVGMGADVESLHQAFMNSEHHRENILDPGLNQLGVGVVVGGDGTVYVTEDFLHSKSVSSSRPAVAPAAAPRAASTSAAPKAVTPRPAAPRVAAAAPVHAAATPPVTTLPAPIPAPVGVVTAVPFDPVPSAAATAGVVAGSFDGGTAIWVAMFGALFLVGAVGGVPQLFAKHGTRAQYRTTT
jgi:Cysteine-rich secretory protein family